MLNLYAVIAETGPDQLEKSYALGLEHLTEEGRNLLASEVGSEPEDLSNQVIAEAAERYAFAQRSSVSKFTSAELLEAITAKSKTRATGLGEIMDHVVAYATDADGDGVPATPLTVEAIVAELEQILSFQDIMVQVRDALRTGSNAGLTRSLLLAKARYARVNSGAALSAQVADGLTYALDALSRSLLDEAASTLGTTAPDPITESDIDNALGRV